MDCSKKRASALGDLPVDPLVEILSRVPAKTICRFKCVSKAWCDLIADPHYRKKLPQAMQGLFCHTYKNLSFSFRFIDLVPRSVPLDIDPCFSFLTELPEIQFLLLSNSCSGRCGLVLFHHVKKWGTARVGYIVCNPTTKEWEAVPACGTPTWQEIYPCLAFDPAVSSHFNLVQFQVGQEEFLSVHVYSSETGAWSDNLIDEQAEEGQFPGWRKISFPRGTFHPCPFINGFLHLIVWDQDELKIVALDAQGKGRRMIPLPHVAERGASVCYFGESQGQLHFMAEEILDVHENKYKLSIWVLQDYNAQEWVLKGTVNSHEVFGENSATEVSMEFQVVGIHQDRNVVFFTHPSRHKLVAYDMDHVELGTIAIFYDQEWLEDTACYVPYF